MNTAIALATARTPPHGALFAEHAWLPGGWHRNVLLEWDATGTLTRVEPNAGRDGRNGVPHAGGPLLPGMPNLHSHAFQRAMAGLTEYRANATDTFWSWRELMYRFAARITPESLAAIARWLYIEMLKAGYTSVCEFHYVHHRPDGMRYAPDHELAACVVEAAASCGIGMTMLPVSYQFSGFGALPPRDDQRRFINSAAQMLELLAALRGARAEHGGLRYGVAPHSLRAVSEASLRHLLAGLDAMDPAAPVHIHVAEQGAEVAACLDCHGARPVQWLLDHVDVNARWCLIHASERLPCVADRLFADALAGGAQATARAVGGLQAGCRADWCVLDPEHPHLVGRPPGTWLSALVFAEHGATPVRDVYTGGEAVVRERVHRHEAAAWRDYRAAVAGLLRTA